MINLDDAQVYKQFDPSDMLSHLRYLPDQCMKAWHDALHLPLAEDYSRINKVVITGMGGSAISGDLVKSVAAQEGMPVFVHRDYELPPFIDDRTLVIASSYSGMTEETLSAFVQALGTKSKKLVITTGGKLKSLADKEGVPVLCFDYRSPPRVALGFGFVSLLGLLQRLGFLSDKSADLTEMISVLRDTVAKIDSSVSLNLNPAKQLAIKLLDRVILIYTAGIFSEVAHRWKTQFNENSKAHAYYEIIPELNHNAVVGYKFPRGENERFAVIFLRAVSVHPRNLARYQVTSEILSQAGIAFEIVDALGTGMLSQMMSLILFGDYVSYYLAILYQIDPTPVTVIDYLKKRLAQI